MNIQENIQKSVQQAVQKIFEVDSEVFIERPKDNTHGDFSVNIAMQLAGRLKRNPLEIANALAKELESSNIESVYKVEAVKPGFINFFIDDSTQAEVLNRILDEGDEFGSSKQGEDQQYIVEYSSPNIAKPFTIGHLRSTIIGDAVANILEFTGHQVYRDNHLGDWGSQFGKQIYAILNFRGGEEENLKILNESDRPVKYLVELYVEFQQKSEEDPSLVEKGREWFKKLEEGDKKAKELWQKCIDWTFKELNEIYDLLGVSFTENEGKGYGESFFEDKMQLVIDELQEKGMLKESEGAKLVFFDKKTKMPPLMILKSNGTTLYATRDLATDKFRLQHYKDPSIKVINETSSEQNLYWKQIFKIEEDLGWYGKGQRIHIGHGLYKFKNMKMSTRKGNVIWLEEVINQAIEKVKEKSKEDLADDEIEKLAIGSLKWNDLKRFYEKDIIFDWDEVLNIEGNSNPYIQYTYVRAKSILNDVALDVDSSVKVDANHLEETGLEVLKQLNQFEEVVLKASKEYSPHVICNYLFDLAGSFNSFYAKVKVNSIEDEDVKRSRLALVKATSIVLKNGLKLLGIDVVERM